MSIKNPTLSNPLEWYVKVTALAPSPIFTTIPLPSNHNCDHQTNLKGQFSCKIHTNFYAYVLFPCAWGIFDTFYTAIDSTH